MPAPKMVVEKVGQPEALRTELVACPRCLAMNPVPVLSGERRAKDCVACGTALDGPGVKLERRLRAWVETLLPWIDGRRQSAMKFIMTVTVAVFIGQVMAALQRNGEVPILSGGHPADGLRFGALLSLPALVAEEPWRLLSAVFVHFGLLHVGLNMLGFYNLVRAVESAVGSARTLVAYTVSGVVGFAANVAALVFMDQRPSFTAGASGAVFGMMGVILGWLWARKDPRWRDFAIQSVIYAVVFGFAVNSSGVGVMVNNTAHLGGLITGVAFGVAHARLNPVRSLDDRRQRTHAGVLPLVRELIWVSLGVVCAVAIVASVILPHWSPLWKDVAAQLDS